MNIRRALTVLIAGCTVAGGVSVGIAPLASAATIEIPVTCDQDITVVADIGDILEFAFDVNNCGAEDDSQFWNSVDRINPGFVGTPIYKNGGDCFQTPSGDCDSTSGNGVWYYEEDGSDIRVTTALLGTNIRSGSLVVGGTIALISGDGLTYYRVILGAPTNEGSGQVPMAPMQGLPLPASGSCADVDESVMTWGRQVVGGWSKSWQSWAVSDDPTVPRWQGFACIRNIHWTPSGWVLSS